MFVSRNFQEEELTAVVGLPAACVVGAGFGVSCFAVGTGLGISFGILKLHLSVAQQYVNRVSSLASGLEVRLVALHKEESAQFLKHRKMMNGSVYNVV